MRKKKYYKRWVRERGKREKKKKEERGKGRDYLGDHGRNISFDI